MDLAAYRHDAEAFYAVREREYYRHYAGLQPGYDVDPIYGRFAHLFSREAVLALRARFAAADAADGHERRRLRMLLAFAADGHVGAATAALESQIAAVQSSTQLELDGVEVGYRDSLAIQANEPDADRRAAIEEARLAVLEGGLAARQREFVERQHEAAQSLGWESYAQMCAECQGVDLAALHEQTQAFLRETDAAYPALIEPHLERVLGLRLAQTRSSDVFRLLRAADMDAQFPAARLLESFQATLHGLGIDVHAQAGLTLDVEARPGKSPRAFCSPVRTPGEVYLVIAPIGGRDDFEALYHEGGHAEHATHVDPDLEFEFRCLGDNAVTEAYAFLLEHLTEDPVWLERRLGVADGAQAAAHARAVRLLYVRRYAAKLAYELELHGAGASPDSRLAARYAELMAGATGFRWPAIAYLDDLDSGFYCTCYLRAWALEVQLRTQLRERFGETWFETPEAGAELRALWSQGQRPAPEELIGTELSFAPLRDELLQV